MVAAVAAATLTPLSGLLAPRPERTAMTAAAVVERASAALADDDIQHSVSTYTVDGGVASQECWLDRVTANQRCWALLPQARAKQTETGQRAGIEWSGPVTWLTTLVDHNRRTWTTRPARPPDGEPPVGIAGIPAPSAQSGEDPRAIFERGQLDLVGEEVIDGTRTYHLRRQISGATEDIWVEAESYRLVRTTSGSDLGVQTDYDWIPRSPTSLELLKVVIPDGYTRV